MNIKQWVLDTFTRMNITQVWYCSRQKKCYLSPALLKKNKKRVCPCCEQEVDNITYSPLGMAYFAFTRPDLTKND